MISTTDAKRHSPEWLAADEAPVFLLRRGSVIERASLEAELAGEHQAGRVFSFELLAAARDGIATLLVDDPDRDLLLALFEQEAGGEELADDERRTVNAARDELAKHWPDYRALVARMARRKEVAPILALQRFLVGWERVPVDFKRGPDGRVPADLLIKVDPLHMLSAGNAAYALLYPAEDLEGNSPRGCSSDSVPATSSSDAPSPAAGRSKGRGGRRTRA